MSQPKALFILHQPACSMIYGLGNRERLEELLDIQAPPMTVEEALGHPELLAEMQVLLGGWGSPALNAEFLPKVPKLTNVFYGAGSVRSVMKPEAWDRGIRVTSSYAANAIPVADFTLAQVILCLKSAYAFARAVRAGKHYTDRGSIPVAGTYRSTVGLVSLGMIGRLVVQRLSILDVKILAYDPFVTAEEAAELGVELASLEEVFANSDVVSLHTPWLPETEKMINGALFRSMKEGAAFINTSRGAVVHEEEMVRVLAERPDLQVVLDVTYPEPPPKDSPLYTLPNVVLTPHIAGSMKLECARMGANVVADVERWLAGQPMQWEITKERAAIMA
jgi:phosphoglycerate dehydrogenase-like enzyme